MDSNAERQLAAAAADGDPSAWEALYRDVYPRMRAYVASRVEPSGVDDVMNETMTRAVAGIGKFSWTSAGFNGWLFGIARRTCADHHRAARRANRPHASTSGAPTADEVGAEFERSEEHQRMRAAFDQLGPRDREVLELRVVAGLSVEETAAVLGKRPGAVRTAQTRALAKLRGIVGSTP